MIPSRNNEQIELQSSRRDSIAMVGQASASSHLVGCTCGRENWTSNLTRPEIAVFEIENEIEGHSNGDFRAVLRSAWTIFEQYLDLPDEVAVSCTCSTHATKASRKTEQVKGSSTRVLTIN